VTTEALIRHALGADPHLALLCLLSVWLRVTPAIWLAPFPGGRMTPVMVKLGLSLLLALLLYPNVIPQVVDLRHAAPLYWGAVLVKEAAIGAALGFVVAIVFWGAEAAGSLVDTSRGDDPSPSAADASSSPLASLFLYLTIIIFILVGGHRVFLSTLGTSYQALPLAVFPASPGLGDFALLGIRLTGDLLLVALTLAAPVLATLFLADITMGLLGRLSGPVNIFSLFIPLRALLSIGVMVLGVGLLADAVPALLEAALSQVGDALRVLSVR